jgi:hypothetical protein
VSPEISVHELDVMNDAAWPFDGTSTPRWQHQNYGSVATFDPYPAYAHELQDVVEAAAHVEACCPPLWNVELYVADREEIARSNGHSSVFADGHYEGDEWIKHDPLGLIMLSGKRIPPHPAMTAYLVGHEYGHNVEWMLNQVRDAPNLYHPDLAREYAQMRELPAETVRHGSGGRWHDAVHEIFACDFRIVVCGVEHGFWPHPGVPRPDDVPALAGWWDTAVQSLKAARAVAALAGGSDA